MTANRNLLVEDARIVNSNWGPPMSYAANLGRDRVIRQLYDLGARDLQQAMGRAVLQSNVETAAMLDEMLGNPAPPPWALDGAAYTLSVPGTEFVFRRGYQVRQGAGTPVAAVIGSDSRQPAAKRRILELYAEHGYVYPDTAMTEIAANELKISAQKVFVGSTGRIGVTMPMKNVQRGIVEATKLLGSKIENADAATLKSAR